MDSSVDFEHCSCFKCPKCDFISLEKNQVIQHVQEHHRQPQTKESLTREDLTSTSSDTHSSQDDQETPVPSENEATNDGIEFSDNKNCDKSKTKKCQVGSCSVRLARDENLDYHQSCHFQSSFKCPECQEVLTNWKTTSMHLYKTHAIDIELLSCSLCDYKTSKSELLKFHVKTHSDVRSFLCDQCGKGFKNIKQLRNHKDLHSTRKVVSPDHQSRNTCNICGKILSNHRLMIAHQNAIHFKVRAHLCNYCGFSTTSQPNLRIHLRQHTGEKPFACSECDFRTADHNSLRRHRAKHSGQKRYQCPHCPYASIQSSTYKTHLKSKHPELSDELIFACPLCTFRTVRKENLQLHHTAVHSSTASLDVKSSTSNDEHQSVNLAVLETTANQQPCLWDPS